MSDPVDLSDLPGIDVSGRLDQVRAAFDPAEIEALVVTSPTNIRWLTGFTGSSATVVVTPTDAQLFTDSRYTLRAPAELEAAGSQAQVVSSLQLGDGVRSVIGDPCRVGLEADHITWAQQRTVDTTWLPDHSVVATSEIIAGLRAVKLPGEIARIRAAAAIVDQALGSVQHRLTESITERQFAAELDAAIRAGGAEDLGFDTIVASGPNAALPHARPTERTIEAGDLIIIDVGARLDGYGSDMTRTFVAGGELSDEQRRWYDAVIAAQAAGVAAVKAGVDEKFIDDECRRVLADHELVDAFIHGTGHGIGLEIHENPILSTRASGILRSGYVVTVEPGAYLPELGGIRIEDSVVVTESGCDPITLSPKSPTVEPI